MFGLTRCIYSVVSVLVCISATAAAAAVSIATVAAAAAVAVDVALPHCCVDTLGMLNNIYHTKEKIDALYTFLQTGFSMCWCKHIIVTSGSKTSTT